MRKIAGANAAFPGFDFSQLTQALQNARQLNVNRNQNAQSNHQKFNPLPQ